MGSQVTTHRNHHLVVVPPALVGDDQDTIIDADAGMARLADIGAVVAVVMMGAGAGHGRKVEQACNQQGRDCGFHCSLQVRGAIGGMPWYYGLEQKWLQGSSSLALRR